MCVCLNILNNSKKCWLQHFSGEQMRKLQLETMYRSMRRDEKSGKGKREEFLLIILIAPAAAANEEVEVGNSGESEFNETKFWQKA